MMQPRAANYQQGCSKRDVQKSAVSTTIDSTCTVGGKTLTSHAVITGSFDSAYTMTVTSQSEGLPAVSRTVTMAAKWIGPCAADQKPGDMIMANGMKINILDAQKRGPPPGVPQPPQWASQAGAAGLRALFRTACCSIAQSGGKRGRAWAMVAKRECQRGPNAIATSDRTKSETTSGHSGQRRAGSGMFHSRPRRYRSNLATDARRSSTERLCGHGCRNRTSKRNSP